MNPKLRPVDAQWVQHNGQQVLLLQDRQGLSDQAVMVPQSLALLLALCDGTRDVAGLRAAFHLRTGMPLSPSAVERFVDQLDEALMLESPRLQEARQKVLDEYRAAPFRKPALAGTSYPDDPVVLGLALAGYGQVLAPEPAVSPAASPIRGLVCPHIDYTRGGATYAQVWARAREAAREAELVVLLGTDHAGAPGRLTLTRQSYATPFGVLPTAMSVVDAVAAALGEEEAFADELHHRREHSIELAAIWLHHVRGGEPCPLVPILCGSFQPFTDGESDPRQHAGFEAALAVLRTAIRSQRTLVVAAADLAHVGPTFGDPAPMGTGERGLLAGSDAQLLATLARADADAFLAELSREKDRRRVCGLPPIYLTLRLLENVQGEVFGYAQCPADAAGTSFVSIAGAVLRERRAVNGLTGAD